MEWPLGKLGEVAQKQREADGLVVCVCLSLSLSPPLFFCDIGFPPSFQSYL